MGDFFFDYVFPAVGGLIALAGLVVLGLASCGLYTSVVSTPAVYACEARNLQAVRQEFTTKVTCRPRNMGSDTLNVKAVQ